jgi:hypothetical protein
LFLQQFIARIAPSDDDSIDTRTMASISRASTNPFESFMSNPFEDAAFADPFAQLREIANASAQNEVVIDPVSDPVFVPSAPLCAVDVEERQNRLAQMVENLTNSKLCNAGCVALDVYFDEYGRATLENASLVFESEFVGK